MERLHAEISESKISKQRFMNYMLDLHASYQGQQSALNELTLSATKFTVLDLSQRSPSDTFIT